MRRIPVSLTFTTTCLLIALLVRAGYAGESAPVEALRQAFQNPPPAMRPSGYWWWFNDLMDKPAITRDLEEFKAKGMGGVMLVCTANGYGVKPMPQGPAFLSPQWRELYKHALREADRLGLELGVNLCPGWCMGGPWITPRMPGGGFSNPASP